MSPIPDLSLVVCDLDGVLVDSSGCHALGYADLWERLEVAGPPYESIAGRATADVVREVTARLSPSPDQLSAWVRFKQEQARRHLERAVVLFPDTAPALRVIAGHCRLALATGASRQTALLLLDRLGLREWFPVIIAAEDVERGKPDPEPFRRAIERSGGDPSRALAIEDSRAGLASALGSGAWAATVRSGLSAPEERFLGAFPDLAALVRHLPWAAA